jgi:SAM-dependent methyltransferase
MDQGKMESFQERIFSELNAGMSILSLQLGETLGLFRILGDSGPSTSHDLAEQTGYSERYLREWLECMVAGGYLDHDSERGMFSLPPEHAEVLTKPESQWSAIGMFGWLSSFGSVMPLLTEAFQTGGGVPYEDYGLDMVTAQAMSTRPMFVNDYVSNWIAAMPDIEAKLKVGGRVAEVGCGLGWSSIALAQGMPNVAIDAVDPDDLSIEKAEQNAKEAGVSNRIRFHPTTIEEASIDGPYDLITAFECLHDMPYPVSALERMRKLTSPDGAVLIADEAVGDTLQENTNFMGHFFYNFSVLHCLPQALAFPDSAGTGTVIKPSIVRQYADEAGFSEVRILNIENPQFRFYRLTP